MNQKEIIEKKEKKNSDLSTHFYTEVNVDSYNDIRQEVVLTHSVIYMTNEKFSSLFLLF